MVLPRRAPALPAPCIFLRSLFANGGRPRYVCRLTRMKRSPALPFLRALVALLIAGLQLVGALHFSLVSHGYSAALGGVVHVHSAAVSKPEARSTPRPSNSSPRMLAGAPSGNADLCAVANAPQSVAPGFEAPDAGPVVFGLARLLNELRVAPLATRRALLGAPKTSPPA